MTFSAPVNRPVRASGLPTPRTVGPSPTLSAIGRAWASAISGTVLILVGWVMRSGIAGPFPVEELPLPPLAIAGVTAKAHTQGLELVGEHFYVTARRDDLRPRQALLLRAQLGAAAWDLWDLTPEKVAGLRPEGVQDHPGGLQFDGERLWIPLAESRRGGQTVIGAFSPAALDPSRPAKPEIQFVVEDHIGALAVSQSRQELWGASWDTEAVYVWNLQGRLLRQLSHTELKVRQLGVAVGRDPRSGLAVQDWKVVGDRLYAVGLFKHPVGPSLSPRSRLLLLDRYWAEDHVLRSIVLDRHQGIELGQEGMALDRDRIYFLPQDLGATNRLLRIRFQHLGCSAVRAYSPPLPASANQQFARFKELDMRSGRGFRLPTTGHGLRRVFSRSTHGRGVGGV